MLATPESRGARAAPETRVAEAAARMAATEVNILKDFVRVAKSCLENFIRLKRR